MCGNVGVAGRINAAEEKAFKDLLIVDAIRGKDSTGAAIVHNSNNTVSIHKELGPPYILFANKKFNEKFKGLHKVLIGHNRFATQGQVAKENAHPFQHQHIIGTHNGTIHNTRLLPDNLLFDVDSDNIIYSIAEKGIEATTPLLIGSYALVWFDRKQQTINFLRNDQRTLFYCWANNGKTLFWASELQMLYLVLERHKIKMDGEKAYYINPHQVSSVKVSGGRKDKISKMSYKDVEQYKYVVSSPHNYNRRSNYGNMYNGGMYGEWNEEHYDVDGVYIPWWKRQDKKADLKLVSDNTQKNYNQAGDKALEDTELAETYTDMHCAGCDEVPDLGEDIEWIDNQTILCSVCKLSSEWRLLSGLQPLDDAEEEKKDAT